LGFILGICADDPRLKKHLNPGQAEQAKQIADEAKEIVEAKDERRAKPALERAEKLRNELPVPTLDLFYAFWSMQQPQISAVEKSEVNQTIIQMEKKADQEDFDEANQQLKRLRELNQAMDQKIPSNLLKAGRK
jgi:type III secretion system FlhB-like substrate exporter